MECSPKVRSIFPKFPTVNDTLADRTMAELTFNGLTFSYDPVPIDQAAKQRKPPKTEHSDDVQKVAQALSSRSQEKQSEAMQSMVNSK